MKIKEGLGWKAGYNEEKGLYGIEIVDQGSWELYEVSGEIFGRLNESTSCSEAAALTADCRRLYFHVNDRCGPPYTVVLDDAYADYCPWMAEAAPAGKTWNSALTDAAVEVMDSEKKNRAQRRKKRENG